MTGTWTSTTWPYDHVETVRPNVGWLHVITTCEGVFFIQDGDTARFFVKRECERTGQPTMDQSVRARDIGDVIMYTHHFRRDEWGYARQYDPNAPEEPEEEDGDLRAGPWASGYGEYPMADELYDLRGGSDGPY